MGLDRQAGVFAIRAETGIQIIRPIGLNFTPTLVEFFPSIVTVAGIVVDAQLAYGAAKASDDRFALSSNSENAQANSDATRIVTDAKCVSLLDPGTTNVLFDADFVSFQFGGWTLSVTTAPATFFAIGFVAWGGSSFQSFIGTITSDAAPGTQTISGLPFKPQAVKFFTTGQTAIPASGNGGIYSVGVTSGVGEEGAAVVTSEDAQATTNTIRKQSDERCILTMDTSGGTIEDAIFESFETDGFKFEWLNASQALKIPFVALEGGQFQVGSFLSQAAAGEFSAISGLDFRPKIGSFFSFCNPETDSNVDGLEFVQGAASGIAGDWRESQRFDLGAVDEDGQAESDADSFGNLTAFYENYDNAQTKEGEIDFVNWEADGLTADETDADAAANEIIYFVAGDPIGKDNTQEAKIAYSMRIRDNRLIIIDTITGREIPPEQVRPNNWLRIEDIFPTTLPRESDLNRDPQITFVESVLVQPPFGVIISGLRSSQPDVFFAGLGLEGVSET